MTDTIFDEHDAPTPSCHASTIAQSGNALVTAWFGGTAEGKPDVGIWLSRATDGRWARPVQVVPSDVTGTPSPCWNPVLFQPKKGPLMLFFKVGDRIRDWQTWLMSSNDHGVSWDPPRHLGRGVVGPVKNKPVELEDGSIVCGSSDEPTWHEWQVYFTRSSDGGETWSVNGPWNDPDLLQAIQPTILVLRGQLIALCRTRQGFIHRSRSTDGGRTWSPLEPTALPNPNSGIDAVSLRDGRHVLVYNHTARGRSPLDVAVSEDGENWQRVHTLESGDGEYSYPAVIETDAGKLEITWTRRRRTIAHVTLQL